MFVYNCKMSFKNCPWFPQNVFSSVTSFGATWKLCQKILNSLFSPPTQMQNWRGTRFEVFSILGLGCCRSRLLLTSVRRWVEAYCWKCETQISATAQLQLSSTKTAPAQRKFLFKLLVPKPILYGVTTSKVLYSK